MLACLLNFASNDFYKNVCRLCTNVDKTINLFSRAGMRNEWSSRISAMLDITIEDDERVSPYVCQKCTRRLSLLEEAIEDLLRHSGAGHIFIECTDEEENQGIGISPDTDRLRPNAKLSRKYNQNVQVDSLLHMTLISQPLKGLPHLHHCTTQAVHVCPVHRNLLLSSCLLFLCSYHVLQLDCLSVISCSDIPPRKNVVVSNFKCVGLLLDYQIVAWDSSLNSRIMN